MNKYIKRIIKSYDKSEKVDNFIVKLAQKDFDNYCKSLFLHSIKYSKYLNSKWFLINIINYYNQLLETELTYTITETELFSVKTKNIFITIPQEHKLNKSFMWLLNDLSYKKLLDYILYLDKEISEINYKKQNYPYLDKYEKITDYNILLHYSNLIE